VVSIFTLIPPETETLFTSFLIPNLDSGGR
jgi:hypothetical protein